MIQYYQLTPEILLEYIYEDDPKINGGNERDIHINEQRTMLLKSNAFGSKYLCFRNEREGLDSISNLVLPLNNTETQFVIAKGEYQDFFSKINSSNMYSSSNGMGYIYEDTDYDKDIIDSGKSCDVKYDRCIIHFTSRNFFGNYDSLIFQAYAYMKDKSKLYLSSFLFKRTTNLRLSEHFLFNGKLYTTYVEFDVPSVLAISHPSQYGDGQKKFNDALTAQNIKLLENTPIGINVYGVSGSTLGTDNYIRLKSLKINSIYIPYTYNRLDEIHVKIYEACDDRFRENKDFNGDFYYISPEIGSGYKTFVDYIESLDESNDVRAYMVMHELCLIEYWVNDDGQNCSEITHKEYYIVDIKDDDEDTDIIEKFNEKIKYRPICVKGGHGYRATIEDRIKIINTINNFSYEVKGSIDIENPNKYGCKLARLGIKNESRPIVNVYNKKVSEENTTKKISLNRGSGFVVENKTQNITSFIESTNVGVKIVELSPDDID